jgi:hypothetical protein
VGVSPTGQVNVGASDGRTGLSFNKTIGTIDRDRVDRSGVDDSTSSRRDSAYAHVFLEQAVAAGAESAITMLAGVCEDPATVHDHLVNGVGLSPDDADWFMAEFPERLRRRFAAERTDSFADMVAALDTVDMNDLTVLWHRMIGSPFVEIPLGLTTDEAAAYRSEVLTRIASSWRAARYDDTCAITGEHHPSAELALAVLPDGYAIVGRTFAPTDLA